MGLFGIGGGKSSTDSSSSSSSFDNLDSFGFNIGGSESLSRSGGRSTSSDQVAFEDIFARLFGGAEGAAGGINPSSITQAANTLFSSGGGFLESLSDGGPGSRALEERLASRDGLADQQVDILGEDINKFLTESVLPEITSKGVAAGTLGGSRGEVSRGIAAEGALDSFRRGATDIRVRDQAARDEIAGSLAQNEIGRAGTGLAALPGLFGLAESGALADLSPFAMLSQILGGPTVLGSSEAENSALAESFGFDLGLDSTTGRAGSQSESTTRSRSRNFSFSNGGG